jgi:hypothetical protein
LAQSAFATPVYSDEIAFFDVSKLQVAFVGMTQCFADGMRQMDIRSLDHDRIWLLLDLDNAVERVFQFFLLLVVSSQAENFTSVA